MFIIDLKFKLSGIAGHYLAMLSGRLCSICGNEVQNFHFSSFVFDSSHHEKHKASLVRYCYHGKKPHHWPKSSEAKQPWSETTETESDNKPFPFPSPLFQMLSAAVMKSCHSTSNQPLPFSTSTEPSKASISR